MTSPPKDFRLFAVADQWTPQAVDDDGRDMTARVAATDRIYPDQFALEPIRGYAKPHALTLDLGPGIAEGRAGRRAAAHGLDRLRLLQRQRRRLAGGPHASSRRRSTSRTSRGRWRRAIDADRAARRTAADDPGGPVGRASPGRARRAARHQHAGLLGSRRGRPPGARRRDVDGDARFDDRCPEVARIFRRAPPRGHRAADLRLLARDAELALEDHDRPIHTRRRRPGAARQLRRHVRHRRSRRRSGAAIRRRRPCRRFRRAGRGRSCCLRTATARRWTSTRRRPTTSSRCRSTA